MQVLCPSCETEYEIPSLQRPRKLRCARCASEWRVMPESEPALADEIATAAPGAEMLAWTGSEPEHGLAADPPLPPDTMAALPGFMAASPGPLLAEQPLAAPTVGGQSAEGAARHRRDALVIGLAWLLSVALVAIGLWALWHWRVAIEHRWPPSLRLYWLVGGVPSPRIVHPHAPG